jgi:hypothetical protein
MRLRYLIEHVLERQRLLKNERIGFPHDDDVRLAPAPAHSAQALLSPHSRVIPKNIIVNSTFSNLPMKEKVLYILLVTLPICNLRKHERAVVLR